MATDKQIAANRRNAQSSTGPKTPAGKEKSSRNATTHGLLARDSIAYGECPGDLQHLRQVYLDHYQPTTPAEEFLVHQLSSAHWRLRRIERIEAGLFRTLILEADQARLSHDEEDEDEKPPSEAEQFDSDSDDFGRAFLRDCKNAASLAILNRYENSLRRAYLKALHELGRLQAPPPQPPAPPAAPNLRPVTPSPAPALTPAPVAQPVAEAAPAASPALRIGFLSQISAAAPAPAAGPVSPRCSSRGVREAYLHEAPAGHRAEACWNGAPAAASARHQADALPGRPLGLEIGEMLVARAA
jgi:hypothetical protein